MPVGVCAYGEPLHLFVYYSVPLMLWFLVLQVSYRLIGLHAVCLRLEVCRGASLAVTCTETCVPLASFRVKTQLAYSEADERPVLVVVIDMAPLLGAGITEVLLFVAGLVLEQLAADMNCALAMLTVGNVSNVSAYAWTLETELF